MLVSSPYDERNTRSGAFTEKYKTVVHDEVGFEAIAKGTWSTAKEDSSFRSGFRRYGAAKLFLIMMMHELQRRMDEDSTLKNICVLGVDPGAMGTGLQRHAPWIIRVLIFQIIYPILMTVLPKDKWPVRTTEKSAADVLRAAFRPASEFGHLPKSLYFNGSEPFEPSVESKDPKKGVLVWKESVRYANLNEGETALVDWH